MPVVTETQTFLTESKTPAIIGYAAMITAMEVASPRIGEMMREQAVLLQMLQQAGIKDTSPELSAKIEEGYNKLGALQRQLSEMQRELRETVATWRAYKAWDTSLRSALAGIGYTL